MPPVYLVRGLTEKFGFLGLLFPAQHDAAARPIVGTLGPGNRNVLNLSVLPSRRARIEKLEALSVQRYPRAR
jgi:hypothetical protein